MEIRELAERVLYGSRLEDKLPRAGSLTDDAAGPARLPPTLPGRPAGLAMDPPRARAPFPKASQLADPTARGRVLHFFANHELLAMELMAVALLRFVDAEPAWRSGLAHVLVEEQEHLAAYRERMEQLGVAFGEIPVSRFFWDCIADAPSPRDFAARLNLVFEQANLDYCLHYARLMRAHGDEPTAAVLDRVYADELGHVRHGLTWWRRWLQPGQDEYEAWVTALALPLSAERARGLGFSREARRQVGFSEAWIDALELVRHSKGRPPLVWLFHPGCERAIGTGGAAPLGIERKVRRQLDALTLFLAARDDVVCLSRAPSPAHLRRLREAGFVLPQIVVSEPEALGQSELVGRKLGGLRPWGWSPTAARWLAPLRPTLVRPEPGWDPAWAPLHDKAFTAARLPALLEALADERIAGPQPGVARDLEAVEGELVRLAAAGFDRAVIKAGLGTAGRDAVRVDTNPGPPFDPHLAHRIAPLLAQTGAVVVEAHLAREIDLSLQGELDAEGRLRVLGLGRFLTSPGGTWTGAWIGDPFRGLPEEQARFLCGEGRDRQWVSRSLVRVLHRLAADAASLGYIGPLGLDALVHRTAAGLRLHPAVELNARFTMGRVALALGRRVAPARSALWLHLSRSARVAAGSPPAASAWLASRAQVRLDAAGLIAHGVLPTTEPTGEGDIVTALAVAPSLSACEALLGGAGP